MQNEETYFSPKSNKIHYLRVIRRWRLVECLSRVQVSVNGVLIGSLGNGQDILIPVESDAIIELDLQSRAWHNYFRLQLIGDGLMEIGYSWSGSGKFFKYNNIRLLKHEGCKILNTSMEISKLQKLDNKFSLIAMGICLIFYLGLQLSRCHFSIHW